MLSQSYVERRGEIEHYFDRTAAAAWARLTSDAPVSRIRATVRAGRDRMRQTLLSWLPDDLRGRRLLDAGCGTGALAMEAARRGAQVVAIDLSPTLIDLARERTQAERNAVSASNGGRIEFHAGDMLDPAHGDFDHVVCMDSIIHYGHADMQRVLACLIERTRESVVFTFAPRTPLLSLMHRVGSLFPRGDRAPMIVPVAESDLLRTVDEDQRFGDWSAPRTQRIQAGFYISQAMELRRR
ncbi:MAG: magnesium protoporphyrin IX methyltransferase [Betaproteobacteria bacterium]|nr:magnesium protoporphyrin IX methyltransferase [Betaproteobacteria bacterium]